MINLLLSLVIAFQGIYPFASPSPRGSSLALVAHAAVGSTDNNTATTGAIDTTGANLLIGCVSFAGSADGPFSDSKGNTWQSLTASPSEGGQIVKMYYAYLPTVGSGHTFTTSGGGADFPTVAVMAFSNTTGSMVDQQNQSGTASGTSIQPGSVTPISSGEVLPTCLGMSNTVSSLAIDSGFTLVDTVQLSGGLHVGGASGYFVQSAAAAINPTWSWMTSIAAPVKIATFK